MIEKHNRNLLSFYFPSCCMYERERHTMKTERYFSKWHPTIRSKYLFFITSDFSPDGLIISIDQSINEKIEKLEEETIID